MSVEVNNKPNIGDFMKALLITLGLGLSLSVSATSVDLKKSSFSWKGTKVSGKHVGKISLKSAKIKKTKAGFIREGNIVMDINSVTVTDLKGEWAGKFLGHVKSGDFLDVKKFPTAALEVTKDDGKTLWANLTIKGKTNPVKFKYNKVGNNYKGTLKFDRTKFDMIYGSGNFFKNLGDKMIHNEVSLDFNLVLGS